eukprot:971032-Rhodomonas_salina.2
MVLGETALAHPHPRPPRRSALRQYRAMHSSRISKYNTVCYVSIELHRALTAIPPPLCHFQEEKKPNNNVALPTSSSGSMKGEKKIGCCAILCAT